MSEAARVLAAKWSNTARHRSTQEIQRTAGSPTGVCMSDSGDDVTLSKLLSNPRGGREASSQPKLAHLDAGLGALLRGVNPGHAPFSLPPRVVAGGRSSRRPLVRQTQATYYAEAWSTGGLGNPRVDIVESSPIPGLSGVAKVQDVTHRADTGYANSFYCCDLPMVSLLREVPNQCSVDRCPAGDPGDRVDSAMGPPHS